MQAEGATKINPPFRADHVGSLLRPSELRSGYRAFIEKQLTGEAFQAIQDRYIKEVVALQEDIGLKVVTDGEFRRASYWAHFVEAVEGFTVQEAVYTFQDQAGEKQAFLAPHVERKVKRTRSISGGEFDFLKSVTKVTPKLTLPSPPTMHFWRGEAAVSPIAYGDRESYFQDLSQVYQEEIEDLGKRGATYLQIDEVPLAMLCDPDVRQAVDTAGDNPERLVDSYIKLINESISNRPEGMTIAMHLCRGNFKGKWLAEGGYDYISERLFNEINVDAYFLEYDSPRAGDFKPLKAIPAPKTAVLGLVSTKVAQLERVDDLRRRIDEASQFIPLERLAISPQCGFASTVAGNPITLADEINKLKLVVEVADKVWGEY